MYGVAPRISTLSIISSKAVLVQTIVALEFAPGVDNVSDVFAKRSEYKVSGHLFPGVTYEDGGLRG